MSKRKGANFEREVKKILEAAGYRVVRSAASLGYDLMADFGTIECKIRKEFSIYNHIKPGQRLIIGEYVIEFLSDFLNNSIVEEIRKNIRITTLVKMKGDADYLIFRANRKKPLILYRWEGSDERGTD